MSDIVAVNAVARTIARLVRMRCRSACAFVALAVLHAPLADAAGRHLPAFLGAIVALLPHVAERCKAVRRGDGASQSHPTRSLAREFASDSFCDSLGVIKVLRERSCHR